MTSRILLSLALTASACGVPAAPATTSSGATPPERGVTEGRVGCTADGGTRVLTPRIRARRDGVHILIQNRGHAAMVETGPEGGDSSHGGRLRRGATRLGGPDGPGEMWVACLDRGEASPLVSDSKARYGTYEIVDPNGLWVSFDPDCDRVEEVDRWFAQGTSVETIEAWVRDEFDLDEGDRMRPGYPETGWKGDPWVIADDDTTFAYFGAYPHRRGGPLLAEAEGC